MYESKVPPYRLPDPLVLPMEKKWPTQDLKSQRSRRSWNCFASMYMESHRQTEGYAVWSEVCRSQALVVRLPQGSTVHCFRQTRWPRMDIYDLPSERSAEASRFFRMNLFGNHTIHKDPGITLSDQGWEQQRDGDCWQQGYGSLRGVRSNRWPVDKILDRGFA